MSKNKKDPKNIKSPTAPANSKSLAALKDRDPLDSYLAEVRKYPLLTREEEFELAKRYYDLGDQDAAQKLVTSNLRFVVKVAAEYSKFGAKLIDLIQEGNMGLMHAVREFDPYKEVKLISYAVWWIRGYIQEYLMKQHSMVKIGTTNSQRKLFYKLNKEKQKLIREGQEPTTKLLSSRLGVREQDVKLMETRLGARDLSLDQPLSEGDNSTLIDLQKDSYHEVMEDQIDFKENMELLSEALKKLEPELSPREKKLLQERLLNDPPKSLSELGREAGVSREAMRQSEARLLTKLKKVFTEITDS